MKNSLKYMLLAVATVFCLHGTAVAQPEEQPEVRDTVYFYDTWEQMLTKTPSGALECPAIEPYTPYQINIFTGNERINQLINSGHIAATLGDSIWLINSEYIKTNFKGDTRRLSHYMPVFFNDKVAFFAYVGYGDNISIKDMLFGEPEYGYDYSEIVDLYYIDFPNSKVLKVTPEVLSGLLEDYHDLQMRYEGMKDYKKRPIIQDYFYKFIDRATSDFMRPYILDVVN